MPSEADHAACERCLSVSQVEGALEVEEGGSARAGGDERRQPLSRLPRNSLSDLPLDDRSGKDDPLHG